MGTLIPVLNMIEFNPPTRGRKKKMAAKKKSYVAAARKAGAVYKSGAKKGKIMSKAQAISRNRSKSTLLSSGTITPRRAFIST